MSSRAVGVDCMTPCGKKERATEACLIQAGSITEGSVNFEHQPSQKQKGQSRMFLIVVTSALSN